MLYLKKSEYLLFTLVGLLFITPTITPANANIPSLDNYRLGPFVEKVVFNFFQNETEMVAGLYNNEIDLIPGISPLMYSIDTMIGPEDVEMDFVPSNSY